MKRPDILDRTFQLSLRIIRLVAELGEATVLRKMFSRQILRCGTSIGANIEEAQAGVTRSDFIHKYSIALKETRETVYWMKLLEESNVFSKEKLALLQTEVEEVGKIIASIIRTAKRNQAKKI